MMRIRLHDKGHLADLIFFMRGAGCIAYQADAGVIEVLRPTRAGAEATELKELLARWNANHPGASLEIL